MATTMFNPTLSAPLALLLPELYSDAALIALAAKNPRLRIEQSSEGYLIVTPPTATSGNFGEADLLSQIYSWNANTGFGKVGGLTGGVRLPKGGQYQTDAFVIAGADWSALSAADRNAGYAPVRPAAVFELLSPSNQTAGGFTSEFQLKLDDYERSAIPLVVLLDPKAEATTIRRPGRNDETVAADIVTFDELPDLELDVAKVFAAIKQ